MPLATVVDAGVMLTAAVPAADATPPPPTKTTDKTSSTAQPTAAAARRSRANRGPINRLSAPLGRMGSTSRRAHQLDRSEIPYDLHRRVRTADMPLTPTPRSISRHLPRRHQRAGRPPVT